MTAPLFPRPEREFREFLAAGRLMLQRSRESGRCHFPPRVAEPGTGSTDLEWIEATGRGTLHSITVVPRKAPEPSHVIILVDLDEGPRLLSVLRGESALAAAIGTRVTARIEPGESPLIVFELAGGRE